MAKGVAVAIPQGPLDPDVTRPRRPPVSHLSVALSVQVVILTFVWFLLAGAAIAFTLLVRTLTPD